MKPEKYDQKDCPVNRICQCHRNGDGICLMKKDNDKNKQLTN